MNRLEFETVVQALLDGSAEPINEGAGYAFHRYVDSRAAYEATVEAHKKFLARAEEAGQKAIDLQGRCNAYAEDLEHWYGVEKEGGSQHGQDDGNWRERFGTSGAGNGSGDGERPE